MLLRCKVLSPPCLSWVKTGKVQSEHIESALPPRSVIRADMPGGRFVPIPAVSACSKR